MTVVGKTIQKNDCACKMNVKTVVESEAREVVIMLGHGNILMRTTVFRPIAGYTK
jgi:hypothetical protein